MYLNEALLICDLARKSRAVDEHKFLAWSLYRISDALSNSGAYIPRWRLSVS